MDGHRFLQANAHRWQEERVWHEDGAALLLVRATRGGAERVQLVGAGEPRPLAGAVARAVADGAGPVDFGLLTRGTWAMVDDAARTRLALHTGPGWDWMWCDAVPPGQPGEERVAPVTGAGAAAEVRACLDRSYPETSVDAGDPRLTWWGYRDDGGALRGVVAVDAWPGGPCHLSGLGTDASWRRRGVASAMTAAVMRWALPVHPYVHLGIWADNDAARRLYARLGFVVEHEVENLRPVKAAA